MTELYKKFLFMKVGDHANESWEDILARKRREFEAAGQIFWGYGGVACHPLTQAQPFARLAIQEQGGIVLIMEPINSKAEPDIVPAREFSRDGINWEPLPNGVHVTGSRYAFVLDEIKPGELDLDLGEFEIGIGPSRGIPAEAYLKGRTDKGCLIRSARPNLPVGRAERIRKVKFQAELKDPFAVLLR
jgi:hypothetical protein